MFKIAVCGSKDYVSERKVAELIKKVYDQFGPTATIISGGSESGTEKWAKKYALEFNLKYLEYNPSFTGHKMYSALPEDYYGKGFHISHFYDRYRKMLDVTDKLFIFVGPTGKLESDLEYLQKNAVKKGVPFILVK